jgi:hypothetical protein
VHQSLHERLRCPLLAELDRDVERVRTGVRQAVDDAADIFDLDGLEAAEGPGEFVAGDLVGHAHRQLVDGPAAVTLEDVDPDHVGSRLTERCRQYPERARPVGEPYADHVPSHTSNLEKLCERQVAVALTLAEIATDQVPGLVPLTTAASFTTCVASTFTKPASSNIFSQAAIETGRSWNRRR